MSLKSNEELIQHKLHEVSENLGQASFLNRYILTTLDSFAYRYFDVPSAAKQISNDVMIVQSLEQGIKEAIKLKNPELRAGITELVKRVSKAEGPTILRELRVTLNKLSGHHNGSALVSARISFGHPKHIFSPGTFVEKVSVCQFEDELQLRNRLARDIEKVCEIF